MFTPFTTSWRRFFFARTPDEWLGSKRSAAPSRLRAGDLYIDRAIFEFALGYEKLE